MSYEVSEYIASLRAFADYLENNDRVHEFVEMECPSVVVRLYARDAEEYANMVRAIGTGSKHADDYSQTFDRGFGYSWNYHWESVDDGRPYVKIEAYIARDKICDRVPTGKVEVKTVRKCVQPAVYEDVEIEEEVMEWDCKPILAPRD